MIKTERAEIEEWVIKKINEKKVEDIVKLLVVLSSKGPKFRTIPAFSSFRGDLAGEVDYTKLITYSDNDGEGDYDSELLSKIIKELTI